MKSKIMKDFIISLILMLTLLTWISLLTWIDFNKTMTGRILGFAVGIIVGTSFIIIHTILAFKKMKRGEQVVDERIIKIQQKAESLTIYILYIAFVILGMIFYTLYYFGYDNGKIISYTFVFILAGMSLIRVPLYYILKSRM